MKRLKKTTLETGVKVLGDLEMKSVIGGYGDVGHFGKYYHCYCDIGGANPPFRSSWSDWFLNDDAARRSIIQRCKDGSGSCSTSGY